MAAFAIYRRNATAVLLLSSVVPFRSLRFMRLNRFLFIAAAFLLHTASATAQSTIFVVRHAEKAAVAEGNKDPDLSDVGRARAESLAAILRDAQITAVFATEYKRTQQTAQPAADRANAKVTVFPANDTAALIAKLKETRGNCLVVGHSNTLADILKALGTPISFTIEDSEYDNLFVIRTSPEPQVLRLHYDRTVLP